MSLLSNEEGVGNPPRSPRCREGDREYSLCGNVKAYLGGLHIVTQITKPFAANGGEVFLHLYLSSTKKND
jgi:hypothetical protein